MHTGQHAYCLQHRGPWTAANAAPDDRYFYYYPVQYFPVGCEHCYCEESKLPGHKKCHKCKSEMKKFSV